MKSMKNGKAPGPSGVTSDMLKNADKAGSKELTKVFR